MIETVSVVFMLFLITSSALLFHVFAPNLEIIEGHPIWSSVVLGFIFAGLASFVASYVIPDCQRTHRVTLCGNDCRGCGNCPIGMPFEAGEFFFVVCIIIAIYVAIVGLIRAVGFFTFLSIFANLLLTVDPHNTAKIIFMYGAIHKVARDSAEMLETTVN